jgi:hypothetical protein
MLATAAASTIIPRSEPMMRNSLGSSGLMGRQLGTGHPVELKIKIGKDS